MPSWPDLRTDEYSFQRFLVNFKQDANNVDKCEKSAHPDQMPLYTWIGSNIVRNLKMSLAIEKM